MTKAKQHRNSSARCVVCGNASVEHNHAGGRNHIAWFTMPFCREHHDQFHALVSTAGINLESTSDPVERLVRAMGALLVAQWILVQALQNLKEENNHA